MKLLYAQQHALFGSAEEYLQILINGVDQMRPEWDIHLLAPHAVEEEWKRAVNPRIRIHPRQESVYGISKQLLEIAPDILHINEPSVNVMAASRLAHHKRTFLTYHTPAKDVNPFYNWKGRVLWHFGKKANNLRLIALSEKNKALLETHYGFPKENVFSVPHGLRPEKFSGSWNRKEIRRQMNLDEQAIVLICPARLCAQKAHTVLLEAFAKVRKKTPLALYLLLAGDGELRRELEAYSQRLSLNGSVRFLGFRNDMIPLLAASDMLVLASRYEGFPFAVLEAMAMNLPVVATDVSGTQEIIRHNITGLLAAPNQSESLAEAILWALLHPPQMSRMAGAAKNEFLEKYTSEKMIRNTLSLYETPKSSS